MNWQLIPPATPPAELLAVCQGPLLARLLAQRGIVDTEAAKGFLNPDHYAPTPASDMVGVVRASGMLRQCLDRRLPVLVWGDFDADGQTSTALLVSALRALADDPALVHWHIPHRVRDNHGVQAGVLADLLPRLSPRHTSPTYPHATRCPSGDTATLVPSTQPSSVNLWTHRREDKSHTYTSPSPEGRARHMKHCSTPQHVTSQDNASPSGTP